MKTLVLISTLVLAAFITNAKGDTKNHIRSDETNSVVTGYVFDAHSGEKLVYANIAIFDKDMNLLAGAITNNQGKFLAEGLKSGKYLLKVSYLGYEPAEEIVLRIKANNEVHVLSNIKLSSQTYALEGVYVKASAHRTSEEKMLEYKNKIEQKIVLANSLNW